MDSNEWEDGIVLDFNIPHRKQIYLKAIFEWIQGLEWKQSFDLESESISLNSLIESLNNDYNDAMGI